MTDFWEPWQPQVGQRVRVRPSAECPYFTPDQPEYLVGVVIQVNPVESEQLRHRYGIQAEIWPGGRWWCLASEMEPVEVPS